MKKYTTKDIAKLADVSRGTVDRVLHGRGKVSEKAEKKVRKILDEIDYKPNVIARTLRESKVTQLSALIPNPEIDPFWIKPMKGINAAFDNYSSFGVSVVQHFYDQNDSSSFKKTAQQILDSKPDGILTAPLFHDEAMEFFGKCESMVLPYLTFNTDIPESGYSCFIGQDLYQSGRIAADLMYSTQKRKGKVLIFHFDEDISNSPHMQAKERGFKDYFKEMNDHDNKFQTINLRDDYSEDLKKILDETLQNENVSGIFVTTSKAYEIVKLIDLELKTFPIIGYDLLEENIDFLKSDRIDFLINQNPRKQAFQGIHHLTELLVFKREIPKKELLPIDIITKENISTYF